MKKILMAILFTSLLIVSACSADSEDNNSMKQSDSDMKMEGMNGSNNGMNMGGMGHGTENLKELNNSTGENELNVPPILNSNKKEGNNVYYTVDAQKGKTEIFKGFETNTLGYNSSFLGPVIELEKGQNVQIKTKNSLDEVTTFHWHGLEIAGNGDGGPHSIIKPGESKNVNFKVEQDAATLWFHPHPMEATATQVFDGLAGLIYIKDDKEKQLAIPQDYGKNDFPLVVQDKSFDKNKQFNYDEVFNPDGTTGDTLLVNGTVNPRLTVEKEKVRLRLLNGSNMRNYVFKLNNNQAFQQIASDGGLLNEPEELTEIRLTPGERAEIIVDFSKVNDGEEVSLVTEEGTVVLPFKIKDTVTKESENLPEKMNNISINEEERSKEVTKKIELFGMGEHVTINGKKFDMNRIDFTQNKGETEVWEIYNKPDMMGGMIHPFHLHGAQFKVISINGKEPPANEKGYKDTIALDPKDKVKIAVKFNKPGTYMFHCHILEHEENGMMGQVKVQ